MNIDELTEEQKKVLKEKIKGTKNPGELDKMAAEIAGRKPERIGVSPTKVVEVEVRSKTLLEIKQDELIAERERAEVASENLDKVIEGSDLGKKVFTKVKQGLIDEKIANEFGNVNKGKRM